MRIVYADTARKDLDEIWDWNDERYGYLRASAYIEFLENGIGKLVREYTAGKTIDGRPGLRRITLRRGSSRNGHIVIYRVDEAAGKVNILHVYHTAQDWRGRLEEFDG